MGHLPNAQLVTVAWVKGIAGIDPTKVATTRPRDKTKWADAGFVQVGAVVGGSPDIHIRQRHTVIELSFWAINLNSAKPPWGKANNLAELVILGCYEANDGGREVTTLLPTGYDGARVQSAYPAGEPREFDGDDASAALYKMDLNIHWTTLQ